MNPDWQTYTHTWHPNLAEESARLIFVLGQIDNTVGAIKQNLYAICHPAGKIQSYCRGRFKTSST